MLDYTQYIQSNLPCTGQLATHWIHYNAITIHCFYCLTNKCTLLGQCAEGHLLGLVANAVCWSSFAITFPSLSIDLIAVNFLATDFSFSVFLSFSGAHYYGDTETPSVSESPVLGAISPAIDRWEAIKRDAIRYGELLKTSYNHGSDKPHGFSNRRLFRLTEEAIEYYHVFFGQVCVCVCVSVCKTCLLSC